LQRVSLLIIYRKLWRKICLKKREIGYFCKKPCSMAEMKQFGLDIELDEAVAQGNYSNLVIISHSTSEFILDFATMLPGLQKARVKSRIILTPEHAKRLLLSLQDNIVRYESNVGKIEIPRPQSGPESGPKMGQA